jgi:hypothetical protein
MNTYTWSISQLDCIPSVDGQINVVSNIHWAISATDGTNNTTVYGTQGLAFDAKNAFTAYSELTKDQVVEWAQEAIGIDAITALQKSLDNRLEALANPPIVRPPLPWSN